MAEHELTPEQKAERDELQSRYIDKLLAEAARLESGEIDEETFSDRLRAIVKRYYILLALIASDGEFSFGPGPDRDDMLVFLAYANSRIDDFLADIRTGGYSAGLTSWRAGLYGMANHVFTRFSVPREVWLNMPVLPGVDCLGDGACGCSLGWTDTGDGIEVEWFLGPTEHCAVCSAAAAQSPYFFPYE